MDYYYVDIETIPNDKETYLSLDEEGRKKLLNPIDSHIVAIGIQKNNEFPRILFGENESALLKEYWSILSTDKKNNRPFRIVGFNIKDFDLPFLVTRSFIQDIPICPFVLKDIIDVREHVSAFKYGHTRGKLKEYAHLLHMETVDDIDGSLLAEQYWAGQHEKIKEYLAKDLEITQTMHQRLVKLRISEIARW